MTWFVTTLAVVLIVITTAAVLGRVDGSLAEPTTSLAHEPLPDDAPLTPEDLDGLRFDTGLRGYRMAQVDRVVDRLRQEIVALEDEVAGLRAATGGLQRRSPSDDDALAGDRSPFSRPDAPPHAEPDHHPVAQQEENA